MSKFEVTLGYSKTIEAADKAEARKVIEQIKWESPLDDEYGPFSTLDAFTDIEEVDREGKELGQPSVGDIVEIAGSSGPIQMKVVLLNEDGEHPGEPGYHGLYLEHVSGSRTLRVMLSAANIGRIVERATPAPVSTASEEGEHTHVAWVLKKLADDTTVIIGMSRFPHCRCSIGYDHVNDIQGAIDLRPDLANKVELATDEVEELRAPAIKFLKMVTAKDAREPLAYLDGLLALIQSARRQSAEEARKDELNMLGKAEEQVENANLVFDVRYYVEQRFRELDRGPVGGVDKK